MLRAELGPQAHIFWFGSWVSGQAVDRSDLDIAVRCEGPLDPATMFRLNDILEGLETLRDINLIDLASVREAFRKKILEEGAEL
ncbi:MAG: nucleotidyltransferase family protein [Candidatus Krumholzibacteriia bacterium]